MPKPVVRVRDGDRADDPVAVRWGLLLALCTLLLGFGLGTAFGVFEDQLKDHLRASGASVLAARYQGDAGAMDAVLRKSWTYFKRAHLHAGAMGAMAIALCLLLARVRGPARLRGACAGLLGAGSLGYPLFWLLAGLRAPGLGGTSAAKDALAWLAIPSVAVFGAGLLLVLALVLMDFFRPK